MRAFGARLVLVTAMGFAIVAVSCRTLTPMEIVLDEQARGQFAGCARNPDRTACPFGPPVANHVEGRWTVNEWRFSGLVHERIELLDVGWQAGRRYRYRAVGAGMKRADCTVRLRHRVDGDVLQAGVKIGPEKEACLQLLYPDLRLGR